MSCTDYQSIIRQWFEDVMETHISKCASCSQFFLELNRNSIRQIEQRYAAQGFPGEVRAERTSGSSIQSEIQTLQPAMGELAPPEPMPAPALPAKAIMGRLNPNREIDPTSPGLICNIGRFILDERELEMLRQMAIQEPTSELGLRLLTIKALEDLKSILNDIISRENVVGWAIIGNDGLLLAGALPDELNVENLAVRALSIYMGVEEMLERIGTDKIQQIILQTSIGTLFIATFGEGIFLTISNRTDPNSIVSTLKRIRDVS